MRAVVDRLPAGRGDRLGVLVRHALTKFEAEIEALDSERARDAAVEMEPDVRSRLLLGVSRKYERLRPQLNVIHQALATYQTCVNNTDVPVGLQHLIDVMMETLAEGHGDPIVCLDSVEMYSTIDLVAEFGELKKEHDGRLDIPAGYTDKHPIALNLPALDPDNALLAPLLAHEVAHTAVEKSLRDKLSAATKKITKDVTKKLGAFKTKHGSGAAAKTTEMYRDWCGELLCDGVAIAVTGPSFVFAFSGYVPPSDHAQLNDHRDC